MDTVTRVLNIAFKFSHSYIHLTRHARMNYLIDCLLDKSTTLKDDLDTLLENYGWKWNDHYIVYCIKPELDNATESTIIPVSVWKTKLKKVSHEKSTGIFCIWLT